MKPILSKTKNSTKLIIFLSGLFYLIFFTWYFSNFKITTWGKIDITSSSIVESYFWTKREMFWSKTLDRIKQIGHHQTKTLLLEKYTQIIPVNQPWAPLRKYKVNSLYALFDSYYQDEDWTSLHKFSQEFIKIYPTKANSWYHLGNSLKQLGQNQSAAKAYYQALTIDNTHLATIKNLSNLLLDQGQYYQAYKVLLPYLNKIPTHGSLCFYWGEKKFTLNNRFCTAKINQKEYAMPINTDNPNHIMVRLDPPLGSFLLKKIALVSFDGQNTIINNFDDWILSKDLIRDQDNHFHNSGNDPYLYTTLPDSIKLLDYNQLIVSLETKKSSDPQINKLLSKLEQKIPLL